MSNTVCIYFSRSHPCLPPILIQHFLLFEKHIMEHWLILIVTNSTLLEGTHYHGSCQLCDYKEVSASSYIHTLACNRERKAA